MKRLKKAIFSIALLFLITFSWNVKAQDEISDGNIVVIADPRLDSLLSKYDRINEAKSSIEGYRIQLIAGSNRSAVYQVKGQFYSSFPDIVTFVIYQQPNFKLRVGNYRNRLEAYRDLQKIASKFQDAFIIRDEIKLSEL